MVLVEIRWWCSSLALLCVAACADDGIEPDVAGELQPARHLLLDAPVTFAAPLAGGAVLAETEEGALLLRGERDTGSVVTAPGRIGELRSVAALEDGTTLLVGSGGVFVVRGGELFVSPIAEAVGDETVHAVVATPRPDAAQDLWVLTDRALHFLRDGVLRGVDLGDVEIDRAATIGVAPGPGGRAVWLGAGGALLELYADGDELSAGRVEGGFTAESMATDGEGRLWLVGNGALHVLDLSRRLRRYRLPVRPLAVRASPEGPDLWIETAGEPWHHEGGTFRPIEPLPSGRYAATAGALLVAGAEGLWRVRARHPMTLIGIEEGTRLGTDVEVTVEVAAAEHVERVEARLDREPLDVAEDPYRVLVPAGEVEPGAHELVVTVHFDDGTLPASRRVAFQVGIDATWSEHILPVYETRCAACHDGTGAAPTTLNDREAWMENIELILRNVREGRMPLNRDPLDPSTVALIEAWAASGFPE